MKNELTNGAPQDHISCPMNINLDSTSDESEEKVTAVMIMAA